MSGSNDSLLARLAGLANNASGEDPLASLAARRPSHDPIQASPSIDALHLIETQQADPAPSPSHKSNDAKLDGLLSRINQLTARDPAATEPASEASLAPANHQPQEAEAGVTDSVELEETPKFVPSEPKTFRDTGLGETDIE